MVFDALEKRVIEMVAIDCFAKIMSLQLLGFSFDDVADLRAGGHGVSKRKMRNVSKHLVRQAVVTSMTPGEARAKSFAKCLNSILNQDLAAWRG